MAVGTYGVIESRLWGTADELRANSKLKSSEYSVPVLGLIFLAYADQKFAAAEKEIAAQSKGKRREPGKVDYQAMGVLYSYLHQTVTTDEFVGYLTNHATGFAYPAVTGHDLKNADILHPPEQLLDAFHRAVEPTLLRCNNLLKRKAKLRQTRDFLLPKLISGEISSGDGFCGDASYSTPGRGTR
jgi:hypothetical protein